MRFDSVIHVEKQADGRYKIVAVSTAALKDQENETFTTAAMDYDIAQAEKSGDYPEFRIFHQKGLGIGEVTKMSRVGIFAVDEGYSYDDPFSLDVCEKMLLSNDGNWKVSRGFRVFEVSGGCPNCAENLVIDTKHMIAGYRCPGCGNVNLGYKGILTDVQFRKTKTFDVTVTDVPAVPFTGVQAFPIFKDLPEDFIMEKEQLKDKLLEAGVTEALIDERMKTVDDDVLKSLTDIPDAIVLKDMENLSDFFKEDTEEAKPDPETEDDDEDEDEEKKEKDFDADVLEISVSELKEIFSESVRSVIVEEIKKALDGFTVEMSGMEGMEIEVKELPEITHVLEEMSALKEAVNKFTKTEEDRVEDIVKETPRSGTLRLLRSRPKEVVDKEKEKLVNADVFSGSDGHRADSMTNFVK